MLKHDYIAIPFRPQGRDFTGCDCWGLVRLYMLEEHGIQLPLLSSAEDIFNSDKMEQIIKKESPLILGEKVDIPSEGCIVLIDVQGIPSHIGVMIDDNNVLHTGAGYGTVVEPLTTNKMKNRIRGFYHVNKSYSSN